MGGTVRIPKERDRQATRGTSISTSARSKARWSDFGRSRMFPRNNSRRSSARSPKNSGTSKRRRRRNRRRREDHRVEGGSCKRRSRTANSAGRRSFGRDRKNQTEALRPASAQCRANHRPARRCRFGPVALSRRGCNVLPKRRRRCRKGMRTNAGNTLTLRRPLFTGKATNSATMRRRCRRSSAIAI